MAKAHRNLDTKTKQVKITTVDNWMNIGSLWPPSSGKIVPFSIRPSSCNGLQYNRQSTSEFSYHDPTGRNYKKEII